MKNSLLGNSGTLIRTSIEHFGHSDVTYLLDDIRCAVGDDISRCGNKIRHGERTHFAKYQDPVTVEFSILVQVDKNLVVPISCPFSQHNRRRS